MICVDGNNRLYSCIKYKCIAVIGLCINDLFFHLILEPSSAMDSGTTNDLSPPNITIYITTAKGIVDYYNATLIGESQNAVTKNVSHATDRVTFSGLYGDTTYTLTLVTHSGDLTSTPYTTEVKTNIISKFLYARF